MALSFSAVTIDRARIERFLEHHLPIAQDGRLEWLIFCPERDHSALEADWVRRYRQLRFFADESLVGINDRRNGLLAEANGKSIMFLDDDSFLAEPARMLEPLLSAAAEHKWLLLSRRYLGQEDRPVLPKSFSVGEVGTGIEWNQLFRTADIRTIGGWDPRFGPGAPWCSGEAFVLMFTLDKAGYRQTHLAEVAISHPAQAVHRDLSNLGKFRSYRKAMGTMFAYLRPRMNRWEFATWLLRMTLVPLPGALFSLLKGDVPMAALRASTPFDIIEGVGAFYTPRSRAAVAAFPPRDTAT